MSQIKQPLSTKQQLLFSIIPVIIFTVVEEWGGLSWALIASVIYAIGEISWEKWKHKKISNMTLFSNIMIVGLSLVSYLTQDGLWFKLQIAILEIVTAGFLIGSYFLKKPILVEMLKQQGHTVTKEFESFFYVLTLRLGLFFVVQSLLAVYASFYWSTELWAFLKSAGVLIMVVIYLIIEMIVFRKKYIK